MLDRIITERGRPEAIRCDNGPEFTSRHFLAWCVERGRSVSPYSAGQPTQNARVESFHGRLRGECLTVSWFQKKNLPKFSRLRGALALRDESRSQVACAETESCAMQESTRYRRYSSRRIRSHQRQSLPLQMERSQTQGRQEEKCLIIAHHALFEPTGFTVGFSSV